MSHEMRTIAHHARTRVEGWDRWCSDDEMCTKVHGTTKGQFVRISRRILFRGLPNDLNWTLVGTALRQLGFLAWIPEPRDLSLWSYSNDDDPMVEYLRVGRPGCVCVRAIVNQ